jgi:protein associated with RNAse G/E
MRTITIRSRKYDGTLRDEYEACLYAEAADTCIVYAPPGTLSYDHRKHAACTTPDGLLELYFKTRWYTVWHICEQHSNVNAMYIHVSLPAAVTATSIEWIDVDIDYRVHLDGRIERLDEDEYQAPTAVDKTVELE